MDFPPEQFPQITYQFERPGTPLSAGNGYAAPTKRLHELKKTSKLDISNVPSQAIKEYVAFVATHGEKTTEIPAIGNPSELKPTHFDVSRLNQPEFVLDEIQFRYGVQGYAAALFSLRFPEDGGLPELVYDPYKDGERVVNPNSMEYQIRLSELKDLITVCQDNPESYRGSVYVGISGGIVHETIEADHHNAATQAINAIDRSIGHPFSR